MKNIKLLAAVIGAVLASVSLGIEAASAHGSGSPSVPPHSHPPFSGSANNPLDSASVFYGEPLPLGNGTFRSFVTFDDHGEPTNIGLTFSQETLSSLPNPANGNPSTFPYPTHFYYPPLPPQASATPFGDLELLYFNDGHTPGGSGYGEEHIDFSFYLPTFAERRSTICPNTNEFFQCFGEELEKAVQAPNPEAVPTGFIQVPPGSQFYALSGAGTAFFNPLEPNPRASLFFGFSEGKMTFIDVLIATDFFSDLATSQPSGGSFTVAIPQPAGYQYAKDGYYPTTYTVTYDEVNKYTVSLGGLTFRSANSTSVPEYSSPLALLGIGTFVLVTSLRTKHRNKAATQSSNNASNF
ncbi:MAG: hypothetical protein ACKPH4_03385 [Microcystis panniformis]